MYDLIIKNGNILDGTGSPRYIADIAVKDGKIARIGKDIEGAAEIIDATGLTVTPGFIDSHSHSDNALIEYPDMIEKVEQGITTSVGGQCGGSVAPAPLSAYPLSEDKKCFVYRAVEIFICNISLSVEISSHFVASGLMYFFIFIL